MNRIDLINRAIPRSIFGYDCTQVDHLMQDLSDALGRVTDEKRQMSIKLQDLETQLTELKERESAMQEAIMATRRMGDDIRTVAQKEAQLILETARVKADALLQNANVRLARLMEEAADAKKARTLFEMKLRAVIDDHLRLLDLNRQQSASLETATKKLAGEHDVTPAPIDPSMERSMEKSGT